MHTTAQHRTKRPFQPQITSFFARSDFDDITDTSDHGLRGLYNLHKQQPPPRESLAPALPGHIQADLLSVGMRVRKSVPEGYKTVNTKMAGLPSIQTALATTRALDVKPLPGPVPDNFVHQRELLPFCGLNKIGGFAEQPTTNSHLYAGVDAQGNKAHNAFPLPAEAFNQPFSSQDSGYGSDIMRPNNPSKRSWHDEDELSLNTNFFFVNNPLKAAVRVDEAPVSPLSESPPQGFGGMAQQRQIAQPKSRRPAVLRTGSEDSMDTDISIEQGVDDFEEAAFLNGDEMDIGGV